MNQQVDDFLTKQKLILKEKNDKIRAEHLISLGLVKVNRTKKYLPENKKDDALYIEVNGYNQEDENGKFRYIEKTTALEVTDEEYKEICELCPPSKSIIKNINDVSSENDRMDNHQLIKPFAEKWLTVFAWIVLVCGILAFFGMWIEASSGYFFNGALFSMGLGIMVSSFLIWSFSLVLVNISRKLEK